MSTFNQSKTHAFIVAVENYRNTINPVQYAQNDAGDFRTWLTNDMGHPSLQSYGDNDNVEGYSVGAATEICL